MTEHNRNVLIGITGGIAAYKIPILIRLLVQKGFNVKVIMTDAAQKFVTPETISVLSKNVVYTSFFNEEREWNNHVHLADWADIFVIAPATANTMAKMTNGYCDNLLLATYLSYTKKVIIVPAMDAEMWENKSVQKNIFQLKEKKHHIVLPVGHGELASGIHGWGRMLEPQEIFHYIKKITEQSEILKGKNVLVTAGATYEPLDPVRFIGNRSSGKTGIAIAEEFALRGANVYLIYGNIQMSLPNYSTMQHSHTPTAEEMYQKCVELFPKMDIAVLSAAVADYTPVQVSNEKIKKSDDNMIITLKKTKDILKSLGEMKQKHQLLAGFALETNNLIENARKKLISKNADIIFANVCSAENPAFNTDENELVAVFKNNTTKHLGKHPKHILAEKIVNEIIIMIKKEES